MRTRIQQGRRVGLERFPKSLNMGTVFFVLRNRSLGEGLAGAEAQRQVPAGPVWAMMR